MRSHEIPAYCLKRIKSLSTQLGTEDRLVKIFGKEIITMGGDKGISQELALFRTHEPTTTNVLRSVLREDMVCLEIGANIGYYVLLEASIIGPRGRIIAVEPSPRSFDYLTKTVAMNRLNNVETFQLAMGNTDSTLDFVVSASSNHNHVLLDGRQASNTKVITIPSMKLDTFAREKGLQRLDLLRMDVEGFELSIISGGISTLRRLRPWILMELHIRMNPAKAATVLKELRDIGYRIRYCIPRSFDYPLFNKFSGALTDLDISSFIERIERREMLVNNYNLFLQ